MKNIGRKLIFQTVSVIPFFLSICSAEASLIPPSQSTGPARIRVRLSESASKVAIRGFDLRIFQSASRTLASAPSQSSEWTFRCQDGRIRAIPADGGATLTLKGPVSIQSPAGMIHYHGKPYRDEIRIHSVGSLCEVVNELDIEKYLGGLVNAEFSSQWSAEAVQAQVIAARTYALYQIRQAHEKARRLGREPRYDVDATVRDQVYDGYVSEDYRGSRAVEKTRGMVLLAKNGSGGLAPIKAFYSSSCAGQTQLPQDVWGNSFPGFKHRVACPYCAGNAKLAWNLNLTSTEAEKLLRQGALEDGAQSGWPKQWRRIIQEGQLVDLKPGAVSLSRMLSVRSVWLWAGNRMELPLSAPKFREWIGPGRLKSTSFQIYLGLEKGAQIFQLSGRGNGHGVGMCQLGAKFMGEKGYTSIAILKHYYPDALLQKLW
ncbi:MAG: SpoIID/LytB domain-containing protein [Bdellovibrionia bacterium]